MINRPLGFIAIVIFAGFNGLLLFVIGMLLTFTNPMPELRGWMTLGGLMLLSVGTVSWAGIYGLWSYHGWGRKIIRLAFLFCIPLNAIAIFPILQNHRMTLGNTILQMACAVASVWSVLYLSVKPFEDLSSGEGTLENQHLAPDETCREEQDQAFTFDRRGRADRID